MVGREVQLVVDRGESHPADVVLKVDDLQRQGRPRPRGRARRLTRGQRRRDPRHRRRRRQRPGRAGRGPRPACVQPIGRHGHSDGRDITGLVRAQLHQAGVAYVPGRPPSLRAGPLLLDSGQPGSDQLRRTRRYARGPAQRPACEAEPTRPSSEYDIRTPSAHVKAGTLSGGNQQKVVVAREFNRKLNLLVLDQPTRGLDVGSIEFIHRQVDREARRGGGSAARLG